MSLSMACLDERICTAFIGTNKGFFSGVQTPVYCQVGYAFERVFTVFIRTAKAFCSDVRAKLWHEATLFPELLFTASERVGETLGLNGDRSPGMPSWKAQPTGLLR